MGKHTAFSTAVKKALIDRGKTGAWLVTQAVCRIVQLSEAV